MKIFVDGTIVYIDCTLYDPFPNVKGEKIMINPDDDEDPQDSENSDNDGTGRPGTV
jgi:hypothetical protein